jgi:hypothetical protein
MPDPKVSIDRERLTRLLSEAEQACRDLGGRSERRALGAAIIDVHKEIVADDVYGRLGPDGGAPPASASLVAAKGRAAEAEAGEGGA